jgi:predicted phosphoribosyltransferase
VDEVVCPRQPEPFGAIGFYYHHFEPVEDEQVRELLEAARAAGVGQ